VKSRERNGAHADEPVGGVVSSRALAGAVIVAALSQATGCLEVIRRLATMRTVTATAIPKATSTMFLEGSPAAPVTNQTVTLTATVRDGDSEALIHVQFTTRRRDITDYAVLLTVEQEERISAPINR
jgi:hypothetical protein